MTLGEYQVDADHTAVPRIRGSQQTRAGRDQIVATQVALKAARAEGNSSFDIAADCHMLAALYDLAAGKEDLARGQMRWIALNIRDYDPTRLARANGVPFIGGELAEFRREHMRFDYNRAVEIFEEEKKDATSTPRSKPY